MHALRVALLVSAFLAVAKSQTCTTFYTGQCPGSSSCLCTYNEPCGTMQYGGQTSCNSDLGGSCQQVLGILECTSTFLFSTLSKPSNQHACMLQVLTGQCPGDATCLTSTGACSAPPPPPSYTWGPDVSSYQGSVAWSSVAASGASFAFTKATEGLTITDSQFAANWAGIAAAGLPRGAYHFGHPCNQGAQEATYFVNAVQAQGVLQSADMLVLDIETPCSNPPDGSIANYCVNFINQVAQLTGSSNLLIYTGAWFWNPNTGGSSALSDYALWVSGYTSSPPMPGGWNSWTYWQYTDSNSVSGISGNVDSSYHPHPPYPSFCVCRSFCALFVDAPVQVFLGHRR